MWPLLFLLIPVSLFAVGCMGSADPCNLEGVIVMRYNPAEFTADELAIFSIVENDWNSFCGKTVLRLLSTDGASGECCVSKNAAFGIGKTHLGRTDKVEGVIELGTPYDCQKSTLQGAVCFQAILAHEVGHMLGLHHVDDPTALMFHQTETTKPNEADRAQCRSAGLCV